MDTSPLDLWCLACGSHHMTYALDYNTNITYFNSPLEVYLGDDNIPLVKRYGDAVMRLCGHQIKIPYMFKTQTECHLCQHTHIYWHNSDIQA